MCVRSVMMVITLTMITSYSAHNVILLFTRNALVSLKYLMRTGCAIHVKLSDLIPNICDVCSVLWEGEPWNLLKYQPIQLFYSNLMENTMNSGKHVEKWSIKIRKTYIYNNKLLSRKKISILIGKYRVMLKLILNRKWKNSLSHCGFGSIWHVLFGYHRFISNSKTPILA